MVGAERVQISDISSIADGTSVTISGMVVDKYKTKSALIASLKDFSGTIKVSVQISERFPQTLFWKQTIMQLTGSVTTTEKGEKRIEEITNVLVFSKNENNTTICLSELDAEISNKASLILMSDICRSVSSYLLRQGFVEFDSRIISYSWQMDGLETLNVLYPGFGSPATLVTSPSPQIIEFLKTTMVSRAFTESVSFATTFRFKDGAAETRVLMGKALDLSEDDLLKTIYSITHSVLTEYSEGEFTYPDLSTDIKKGQWPEYDIGINRNTFDIVVYQTDFEVSTENYYSKIEKVIHIIDGNNNILAEGAREILPNDLVVSTITIYPSQFLALLRKAPARQLQELWRKHGW